jgi:hypothetical protein
MFGPSSPYFNARAWRLLRALINQEISNHQGIGNHHWVADESHVYPLGVKMVRLRDLLPLAKITESDALQIVDFLLQEGVLGIRYLAEPIGVVIRTTGKLTALKQESEPGCE